MHDLCMSCDCVTLTTPFLQTVVLWIVSFLVNIFLFLQLRGVSSITVYVTHQERLA